MRESVQLESRQETATTHRGETGISRRLLSLDTLRGAVKLLMLNEATRLPVVGRSFPHSTMAFIRV